MKNEEFNLSKRICPRKYFLPKHIHVPDVKEFIRRLKEINFTKMRRNIIHSIDKLAGEDLI